MSKYFAVVCVVEWADKLTEMSEGKHFIGDFLPPDELERFMETYDVSLSCSSSQSYSSSQVTAVM